MMNKNMKKSAIALGLIGVMSLAGISAYFTATDTATNNFNVKEVNTELTEPNYEDGQDVTPNETITKDPTVTNVGTTGQYVFLSVKVPYKNIITAQANGALANEGNAAITDLFSLNDVSQDWVLVKTNDLTTEGVHEYIYAYGTSTEMKTLAVDASTPALFQSVTMCNAIEGQGLENTEVDIDIDVYAIQDTDLSVSGNGVKTPAEVLSIYLNQNA